MSSGFHSRTKDTRDDWQTPIALVNALGKFDLDPCPNQRFLTRLAPHGITEAEDGLKAPWVGRVFLNPPYGAKAKDWVRRLAVHGNGIALIAPRMGAAWFHDEVLKRASAVFFLRGRVAFINPDTGNPVAGNNADSMLVAFGEKNRAPLEHCGLQGVFVDGRNLWCRT